MSITTGDSYIIVDFSINSVSGRPAVGGGLLQISINYRITPKREDYCAACFTNTFGKVFVGPNRKFLGIARPETAIRYQQNERAFSAPIHYEMKLSHSEIEGIERLRAGEELQILLEMHGEYYDGWNRGANTESMNYTVSREEWVQALSRMEFSDGFVFDLPSIRNPSKNIKTAYDCIRKARRHMAYGNFYEAVADCRVALERVKNDWGKMGEVNKKAKENLQSLNKIERFFYSLNYFMNYTHLAHHADQNSEITDFDRSDAVYAIGVAIAIVSSYAQKKDGGLL